MSSAASSYMKNALDTYDSGMSALYDGAEFIVSVLDEPYDEIEAQVPERAASND